MAYGGERNMRKGPWLEEEDELLTAFVTLLGERKWDSLAKASGLMRSGKSCRLRWLNYLRPNLKRGHISAEEEQIIVQLHELWGNKWARIARRLPVRTDNEIKNYWRTHLRKKIQVHEEGFEVNNAKEDLVHKKGDTISACKYNINDCSSSFDNNNKGNTECCRMNHCDYLSSLTYLKSPYEERLYDWIAELSGDGSETKIYADGNGLDRCFCYGAWNFPDSDSRTLDSFGSLWDAY